MNKFFTKICNKNLKLSLRGKYCNYFICNLNHHNNVDMNNHYLNSLYDNYDVKKLNNDFSSLSLKSVMLSESIDIKLKIRKNKLNFIL